MSERNDSEGGVGYVQVDRSRQLRRLSLLTPSGTLGVVESVPFRAYLPYWKVLVRLLPLRIS